MSVQTAHRYFRNEPFRLVEVSGSPYQLGVGHGRQAADLIGASLELYRKRFEQQNRLSWPRVLELAADIRNAIEDYDAASMEEMRGIASGADQPLEAIVALNARTELLALSHKSVLDPVADECTSAVCLPDATANGHALLGRNWDQNLGCLNNTMVLLARPADHLPVLALTEAGILIREGVNEAGIGVTGNILNCDQDGDRLRGMPVSVVRRRLLRHESLSQALREVFEASRAHSVNHLIADAAGEAIDLEVTPRDVFWVHPDDGILVHSNHFLDPRAAVTVRDAGPEQSPSTLYRHRRVRGHLSARNGRIGVRDMQTAFRDHYGWPDSVCSHPDETPKRSESGSVASIVIDLHDRLMFVAPHPICENEYTAYSLV